MKPNMKQEIGLLAGVLSGPPPREPKRDFVLLAVATLLTAASFATTVQGAKILFSDSHTAWALAVAVQLVPFLFATGLAGQNLSLPVRGSLALLSIVISVNASAAYFNSTIGDKAAAEEQMNKAAEQHGWLLSNTIAPQTQTVQDAQRKHEELTTARTKEEAHGTTSGRGAGYGDGARALDRQLTTVTALRDEELRVLQAMKKDLDYNFNGLDATQILERDRDGWSRLPPHLRAKVEQPTAKTYLNADEQSVPLLRPLKRLFRGAPHSREIFALSALIDLLGILVGMGVPIRSAAGRHSWVQTLGLLISGFIRNVRQALRQIFDAVVTDADESPIYPPSFYDGLLGTAMANIQAELNDGIAEFLSMFVSKMNPKTWVIDVEGMAEYWGEGRQLRQSTMLSALSKLVAALASQPCEWIVQGADGRWKCRDKRAFANVQHYLHGQLRLLRRLAAEEKGNAATPADRNLIRNLVAWLASWLPGAKPAGPAQSK